MTKICNFPISEKKRCTQPVAGDKPNCGRHRINLSADQLGQNSTVYEKGGELHIWAGRPNDVYCLIHNDPAYQALCQMAGEIQPCCLNRAVGYWYQDGELHRDDGPAIIEPDGTQHWYQHGELHRDDGPARIWLDGKQHWYQHGKLHRDDGPAIIESNGTQIWYQHGEWHRDDGPAAIWPSGTKAWYQYNELHRDDGPAVIEADGTQSWHWHNEEVTEEEYARLRKQSKST